MCLKKHELKGNIDNHDQIFIVMTPKAGGKSIGNFARKCLGNAASFQRHFSLPTLRKDWLTQSYDTPNVLVGHILEGKAMESLIKGVSKDSLIVYIHREETSRLASAIKHVMAKLCEGDDKNRQASKNFSFVQRNEADHTCTTEENDLVDKVIQPKLHEIKASVHQVWSCDTFHTLNDNRPNLVTMNMNQIDTLQKMLAEKFCPEFANEQPVHSDEASKREIRNFVRLSSNSSKVVSLDEWVLKKKNMIAYTLGFKENIGCQKNVRDMEDELFETCSDTVN